MALRITRKYSSETVSGSIFREGRKTPTILDPLEGISYFEELQISEKVY
jgi:hypothetical protein